MNNTSLARKAGMAGMIGATLWILGIIWEYALGLQPPGEGAMFVANQLLFFVAMAGIAVGYLGILWGNGIGSLFGKISTGMAALGYLLLIVASFISLFLGDEESPIFILFPIGGMLMSFGVLLTGIGVARTGSWSGWQRWIPLAYAAFFWLAMQIPFIADVTPNGPDMAAEIFQGIGLFLVALATYTAAAEDTTVAFQDAGFEQL